MLREGLNLGDGIGQLPPGCRAPAAMRLAAAHALEASERGLCQHRFGVFVLRRLREIQLPDGEPNFGALASDLESCFAAERPMPS